MRSAADMPDAAATLILRGASLLDGRVADVALAAGGIVAMGDVSGWRGPSLDAHGQTLLAGLHDHHIHLFATAAARVSVDLAGVTAADAIIAKLRAAAASLPENGWLRATGFDEAATGLPHADLLESWLPGRPLRMLDRTGACWLLNRSALARLGSGPYPPGVALDAAGIPTGQLWRCDDWLRARIGGDAPDLAALGAELAALGITALTDAGARNGTGEAQALVSAGLRQSLTIMGDETLIAGEGYALGALKLMMDERDLPPLDALAARIVTARGQGRAVAAHCVTAAELALYLAALDMAGGALPGDRIEHGAVIPAGMIAEVAMRGLCVITQPAFVHARGDRYRAEIPTEDWCDLWRISSLFDAKIPVFAGSDAPYGPFDPWLGMAAARDRRTKGGFPLVLAEGISAAQALRLYHAPLLGAYVGTNDSASGLILVEGGMDAILAEPDAARMRATIIGGEVVFSR